MPSCLKCGTELPVNEEGLAPVLCDRCAGVATSRARQRMNAVGTMRDYPAMAALVAINLSVFIAMIINGGSPMGFSPDVLIRWGANWGPATMSGDYWRLITAGFVHGSIIHIAFNMWCLWSLCQLAERLFGSLITIAIYLLTGVAGAMLSIAWNHGRLEVGASDRKSTRLNSSHANISYAVFCLKKKKKEKEKSTNITQQRILL